MTEKNINVLLVLIAIVVMFAIAAHHFDRVQLSIASLGLDIKAGADDTTFVNLPAIVQELESSRS